MTRIISVVSANRVGKIALDEERNFQFLFIHSSFNMRIAAAICVVFLVCYTCGTIIDDHKVLIQLAENEEPIWMTPHQRNELKKAGISFVDVTNFQDRPAASVPGAPPLPNQPQQKFYVKSLLPKLNTNNMRSNVEILSDLRTRFYTTSTGTQAAEWIHSTLKAYASNRPDITVEFFNSTTTKPQPSVIARFPGQLSSDLAIIGCHEDSVNLGSVGTSPGVDDDGSGVVCNLEIFRVLATSGFMPNRTVEFHFYAAEEVGLLGSQAVASTYADENKVVVGMMQLDMTLYPGTNNENVVGVVVDYTDPDLSEFTRELVEAYTDIPWVDTVCGYGCSDHYSWTKEGYRSTFPFESEFSKKNPYIHSAQDTLAHADFQHALQFAKLGLGFVVELGATNYMD